MKKLRLKRGQERNILDGSLWIFSNQVEDSLKNYHPGEIVHLMTKGSKPLGIGYVNPHSLIAFRLLSRVVEVISTDFFVKRLKKAQKLRRQILPNEAAVREVFSESDNLPGLVVDRYGEILVVQVTTAGMEALKTTLIAALEEVYLPRGIYERSDLAYRKLEGLEEQTGLLTGTVPDAPIWLKFTGVTVPVDIRNGQKTGLYLDQRRNVEFIETLARGRKVLDAFCYVGVWGLQAAKAGAAEVTLMDSSAGALDLAMKAARRNKVATVCKSVKTDSFDGLKNFAQRQEIFDLIILDPPSFIRSRAHFKEGYKGYFDLNQRALAVLEPGGILISCSCSHHLNESTFMQLMVTVLRRSGRQGRLFFRGYQGPDHPVLVNMPETEYLHCLALEVD